MMQYKRYFTWQHQLIEATSFEPDLVQSNEPSIQELVIEDIQEFDQVNAERYGMLDGIESRLPKNPGALIEAYQVLEAYQGAIALVLSLRKAIYIKTGR